MNPTILVGYSGHGLVAAEILTSAGISLAGYCDQSEKASNPFELVYLGDDKAYLSLHKGAYFFVAIGDNRIRTKVQMGLIALSGVPINAIHTSSIVSKGVKIGHGVMIGARVVVHPMAQIGHGAILNTSSVIEHECRIADFAHIGPGAVLCGNVTVGAGSFVGAGSVVRQGITIGENVTIGAGSVVVKDVPDGYVVMGNPARRK